MPPSAYRQANLERERARNKEWRLQNPEKSREYIKTWRAKNPEKVATQTRRYKEKCKTPREGESFREWQRRLFNMRKGQGRGAIKPEHLTWPTHCPILGIELDYSGKGPDHNASWSVDRIDSTRGYEPGNVWIISKRANTIKSDATIAELEAVVTAIKDKICGRQSAAPL